MLGAVGVIVSVDDYVFNSWWRISNGRWGLIQCPKRLLVQARGARRQAGDAPRPLAQARLRVQGGLRGRGQCLGGLPGALQVAAVNGGQGFIGQRLGRLLGLGLARGVQGNVGVALNAASRIPGGFAVPNGNDAGCVHGQEKKGVKKRLILG